MTRSTAAPYPLRQKVAPFIRGLLEASPLVEVALSGLERDLTARERAGYISRIAERGHTRHIYRAFLSGLGEGEQNLLARSFERRYESMKLRAMGSAGRQDCEHPAPILQELGRIEARDAVADAFILLRDGYVGSAEAQLGFACILYADGMKEHAAELVSKGKLGRAAFQVMVSKCQGQEHAA